jgi:FKBP-type peptidyl-prolyl cis-trans isomerase
MKHVALILVLLACLACVRKSAQLPANKADNTPTTQQEMLDYNKACLQAETNEIQAYLDSNTNYVASTEGWWLHVVKKGDGAAIQPMQMVTLNYQVERLDGTICLSSATDGSKTIVVGKRQWLQGIDLLLPTLTVGSEVVAIFPSRMAYGLRGKSPCIGSYCPILCRIQIIPNP